MFGIDFRMVAPYSVSLFRVQNMEVKWSKLSSGCLYRWWTLGKTQPPSPHMSSFMRAGVATSNHHLSVCLCQLSNCVRFYNAPGFDYYDAQVSSLYFQTPGQFQIVR